MSSNLPPVPVPACPGGSLYPIKAGDTLNALAARFGVSLAAIVAANPGIVPGNLQIGQVICIPGRGFCPGGTPYSIRAGDTLYQIALRFGFSLQDLLAANPQIDPIRLQIGQIICLPIPPGPSPLCCVTLFLVSEIPLSQLFPGGVTMIKPAATATDAVSVTFAASGLPLPSAFGDFDTYVGQVIIPAASTNTPPTVYGVILTQIQAVDQPLTWAGTRVIPEMIPSSAVLEIRVIKLSVGRGGIQILRNMGGVCVRL